MSNENMEKQGETDVIMVINDPKITECFVKMDGEINVLKQKVIAVNHKLNGLKFVLGVGVALFGGYCAGKIARKCYDDRKNEHKNDEN